MSFRDLIALLLGLLFALWEIVVRPFLPSGLDVSLIIPAIVLVVMTSTVRRACLFAGAAGVFVDAYALPVASFTSVRFLLLAIILHAVAGRWLTNRSLYAALALGVGARVLDAGMAMIAYRLRGETHLFSLYSTHPIILVAADVFFIMAGFLFLTYFTRRFNPLSQRGGSTSYGSPNVF